jgi:hypothetical protein
MVHPVLLFVAALLFSLLWHDFVAAFLFVITGEEV